MRENHGSYILSPIARFCKVSEMDNVSFFDSIASRWDQIAHHDEKKVAYIVRSANIEGNSRVLDLGTGTGILLPFIKEYLENDGNIVALDISANMLEQAKKKNGTENIEYVCSDFYEYENDEKFSVIIAYSCFPHFADRDLFFKKCEELLRDKGRLVIAHSESKEKINGKHTNIDAELKSETLKDAVEVAGIAGKYGLIESRVIDNEEYYLIVLDKR